MCFMHCEQLEGMATAIAFCNMAHAEAAVNKWACGVDVEAQRLEETTEGGDS